ncbi:hypothetical protein ACTMSW_09555 [Micromonospora sp. BQ11]|uniref:hypothetical protein n=1 Tax=Micromonospora sp. BQ11 TaxID=3452212 RepID=UPI003F8B7A2E
MSLAPALLPHTVRGARWTPVAAAAAAGIAFVLVMTLVPVTHDTTGLTNVLRIAALFGAVGAAFLLDDPSESSTAATPVPRPLRILLRPLVAIPALLLWWASVLLLLRRDTDPQTWQAVPAAGCTLEMAALATVALAAAAHAVRRPPHTEGGTTAAPTVIVLVAAAQFAPDRYRLFPAPRDEHWITVHRWWMVILIVALLLLAWASRDLAATRRCGRSAAARSGRRGRR